MGMTAHYLSSPDPVQNSAPAMHNLYDDRYEGEGERGKSGRDEGREGEGGGERKGGCQKQCDFGGGGRGSQIGGEVPSHTCSYVCLYAGVMVAWFRAGVRRH